MIKARPVNPHLVAPLIWRNVAGNPLLPPGLDEAWMAQHTAQSRALGFFHGRELIGCATFRGHEMHLDIVPAWRGRWLNLELVRHVVNYGLERSPVLVARIEPHQRIVRRMAEYFGFRLAGQDALSVHYQITRDDWSESPYA